MNGYLEQARAAIEATIIRSETMFSWRGRESARIHARIRRAMTPRTARNYLRHRLQSQLYSDFYVRGGASPQLWDQDGGAADPVSFVEALSAANTGNGCREDGWEVLTAAADEVTARRHGVTLWIGRADCCVAADHVITAGARVSLRLPKELPHISPGYYMVLGDQSAASDKEDRLVRLYWNLTADGAAAFVGAATTLLNGAGVFFRLKVLNDQRSYARCDAGVIYLQRDDYVSAAGIISRIHADVARFLKPATPVFTKVLAPGCGLAEDTGRAESFGEHRCRLLAEGMVRAYERRVRSLDARLAIVEECYRQEGLELAQPYLASNSSDIYRFGDGTTAT